MVRSLSYSTAGLNFKDYIYVPIPPVERTDVLSVIFCRGKIRKDQKRRKWSLGCVLTVDEGKAFFALLINNYL